MEMGTCRGCGKLWPLEILQNMDFKATLYVKDLLLSDNQKVSGYVINSIRLEDETE